MAEEYWQPLTDKIVTLGDDSQYAEHKEGWIYIRNVKSEHFYVAICTKFKWIHLDEEQGWTGKQLTKLIKQRVQLGKSLSNITVHARENDKRAAGEAPGYIINFQVGGKPYQVTESEKKRNMKKHIEETAILKKTESFGIF